MRLVTCDYTTMDATAKETFNELIEFESSLPFQFEKNFDYSEFQPKPKLPSFLQPQTNSQPHRLLRNPVEQQYQQAELHKQQYQAKQQQAYFQTQVQMAPANHGQAQVQLATANHGQAQVQLATANHGQAQVQLATANHGHTQVQLATANHGHTQVQFATANHGQAQAKLASSNHGQVQLAAADQGQTKTVGMLLEPQSLSYQQINHHQNVTMTAYPMELQQAFQQAEAQPNSHQDHNVSHEGQPTIMPVHNNEQEQNNSDHVKGEPRVEQLQDNEQEELLDIADLEDVIKKLIQNDEEEAKKRKESAASDQEQIVSQFQILQYQNAQQAMPHQLQQQQLLVQEEYSLNDHLLQQSNEEYFLQSGHTSLAQNQAQQVMQMTQNPTVQLSQQAPQQAFISVQQQENLSHQGYSMNQQHQDWTILQQFRDGQNSFPQVMNSVNFHQISPSTSLQRTTTEILIPKGESLSNAESRPQKRLREAEIEGHCSKKSFFGIEVENHGEEEQGNEIILSSERALFESAKPGGMELNAQLQGKSNVTLAKFQPPKIIKQPSRMFGRQNMTYPLPQQQRQSKSESVIYQIIDGPSTSSANNVDSATTNLFKLVYEESVPAEVVLATTEATEHANETNDDVPDLTPPTPNYPPSSMRHRAVIKYEFRLILEEAFQVSQFPNRTERSRLGLLTELDQRQVQIWFQNQRSKAKKMAK